jgi:putative ABC transport system substrate-binding protein
MDRRTFLIALAALYGCGQKEESGPAHSDEGKVYRIGYLGQGSRESDSVTTGAGLAVLIEALRGLGYNEGKNLSVKAVFADDRPKSASDAVAELLRADLQVIAVPSAGLAMEVREHTRTIPIVALSAGSLETTEGVASLTHPAGNVTGMQLYNPESMGLRLQFLQELVPNLRRVAVLRGVPFGGLGYFRYRDATVAGAEKLGVRVLFYQFETATDLPRRFEDFAAYGDQALLVWGNPHLNLHRREIHELAMRHRLPAVYDSPGVREELLVYAANMPEVVREAATYVDKILKGAKAGDLAIGQAKTFDLVINLATAKALRIVVPNSLLSRATEVIR